MHRQRARLGQRHQTRLLTQSSNVGLGIISRSFQWSFSIRLPNHTPKALSRAPYWVAEISAFFSIFLLSSYIYTYINSRNIGCCFSKLPSNESTAVIVTDYLSVCSALPIYGSEFNTPEHVSLSNTCKLTKNLVAEGTGPPRIVSK